MKKLILLLLIFFSNVYASDDLNVTIVDFTPDVVTNYFISIFMWGTVLILPFIIAIALIMNVSNK